MPQQLLYARKAISRFGIGVATGGVPTMVSWMSGVIALSLGLLTYTLPAITANLARHPRTKKRIGDYYYKKAARIRQQFSILRRILGGYDYLEITVDPEQKLLKNTLSSNLTGEDNEFPFNDPDNRIQYLYNKPVALVYERIPAAIDAELALIGKYAHEKRDNEGFWTKEWDEDEAWNEDGEWTGRVDPYIEVPNHHTQELVDPVDAVELVPNAVDPENIKTAEQLTRQRFTRYGPRVSLEATVAAAMGFLLGVGTMAGISFFQEKFLQGSTGGLGDTPVFDVPIHLTPVLMESMSVIL